MRKTALLLIFCLVSDFLAAQTDTLKTQNVKEIVVTASRTEKSAEEVSVPLSLIAQKQIKQAGNLRLNDLLAEQTGLQIVAGHGQGVQMQGFNPDYTLILLDGEPLIGRTAGTLELSRIALGNIEQIEILKGASSSLYGSEALAGVINIITQKNKDTSLSLSSRYGSNQTSDFSGEVALGKNNWQAGIFLNRFSSEGYDFTPETFGKTVEPFRNYTVQAKIRRDFTPKINFSLSGRYFEEHQTQNFLVSAENDLQKVSGNGFSADYNLTSALKIRLKNRFLLRLSLYSAAYKTSSSLLFVQNKELFEQSFFKQSFLRPEAQADYFFSEKHSFTLGTGMISESVLASRYTGKKQFSNLYAYFQYEFSPSERMQITLGGRFDAHSVYGSQVSPKLSARCRVSPRLTLRASAGVGFKAPDFRQLYLNFNNTIAGYAVYGAQELPDILREWEKQGQIAEILVPVSEAGDLQAEKSRSFNLGGTFNFSEKMQFSLNIFRNDVSHLIETQIVAKRTNGQNIYGYRNLNSIFTEGIETDWKYLFNANCSFSVGYQFLNVKDKDILTKIEAGEIYRRDPETLATERLHAADYRGLFGRSKHSGNMKFFYEIPQKGISGTMRLVFRGRYGFGDRDGNLIYDSESESVGGYCTWHISFAKTFFSEKIRIQIGIDNLLNYRDPNNIPNLAGRLCWASMSFSLQKKRGVQRTSVR